jgi:hypothetical protein
VLFTTSVKQGLMTLSSSQSDTELALVEPSVEDPPPLDSLAVPQPDRPRVAASPAARITFLEFISCYLFPFDKCDLYETAFIFFLPPSTKLGATCMTVINEIVT